MHINLLPCHIVKIADIDTVYAYSMILRSIPMTALCFLGIIFKKICMIFNYLSISGSI